MSFSDEEQALERTFVMVKPEGAQRRLIGQIVSRFERSGLKLVALKFVQPTIEQLTDHYIEHIDRDYFSSMIEYLSTGDPKKFTSSCQIYDPSQNLNKVKFFLEKPYFKEIIKLRMVHF